MTTIGASCPVYIAKGNGVSQKDTEKTTADLVKKMENTYRSDLDKRYDVGINGNLKFRRYEATAFPTAAYQVVIHNPNPYTTTLYALDKKGKLVGVVLQVNIGKSKSIPIVNDHYRILGDAALDLLKQTKLKRV
jgi:hypothetical protein